MEKNIYCFNCGGTGKEINGECSECGSTHWIWEDEMIDMLEYQTEDR